MKIALFILLICLPELFPQNVNKALLKDTSYTIHSAHKKLIGEFPFIKVVDAEIPENISSAKEIIYTSYGKRNLHLDLFQPKDQTELLPAVLIIHGGGWKSGDKSLMHPIAIKLASAGYITAAVEYRLSPEAKYPAALFDLKEAVKWLKANSNQFGIDSNKIAVLGCSAGGTLAALVGTTNGLKAFEIAESKFDNSSEVHAVINVDGILDFTHPAESSKDDDPSKPSAGKLWLGASYKLDPELWINASPLTYVNEYTPPIIFINSSIDRFHAGRDEMIKKLNKYGVFFEVKSIENTPHSFWLFHPWFEETAHHIINFLDKIFK
jgi:acetyl esterase/lipase